MIKAGPFMSTPKQSRHPCRPSQGLDQAPRRTTAWAFDLLVSLPQQSSQVIFLPQSKSHTVRLKSNESVARYIVGAVRGAKFYRALGLPQALFWDSELRSPTSGKANGLLTEFRKTQVPSRQFDLLPPFFHISFHFAFCSTGGLESWSSRPGDVPLCPELSAPSFSEDRHKSSAFFGGAPISFLPAISHRNKGEVYTQTLSDTPGPFSNPAGPHTDRCSRSEHGILFADLPALDMCHSGSIA